jgi:hypothetical protein
MQRINAGINAAHQCSASMQASMQRINAGINE